MYGDLRMMHTRGNQPIRYDSKTGRYQVIHIETNIKAQRYPKDP